MPDNAIITPLRYSLLVVLLCGASAWAMEVLEPLQITGDPLPGTTIHLSSSEEDDRLSAEVSATLPYSFHTVANTLSRPGNWCDFMPLHFNIKACTHETKQKASFLTLYSGRKHYHQPEQGNAITYQFAVERANESGLSLQLTAEHGPIGTSDYRIQLRASPQPQGTLLQVSSSYRPSLLSKVMTRGYLATLGRDKVGFSRIESNGGQQLVQGIRGVIERNVMRYHLAIDSFLATHSLPEASRHDSARRAWFRLNEGYPRQLHEMSEEEYLSAKRREWDHQRQLQQQLDAKIALVAAR